MANVSETVIERLSKVCGQHSTTLQTDGTEGLHAHSDRTESLALSWSADLVVFSISTAAVLKRSDVVSELVELAATDALPSPVATASAPDYPAASGATQLIVNLLDQLGTRRTVAQTLSPTKSPDCQENTSAHSAQSADATATKQQQQVLTSEQIANLVSDADVMLPSILLLVKLLILSTAPDTSLSDTAKPVVAVLWSTLVSMLNLSARHMPALNFRLSNFLADPSVMPHKQLEQQQLPSAIFRLTASLLRFSLRQDIRHIKTCCTVLEQTLAMSGPATSSGAAALVKAGILATNVLCRECTACTL